MPACAVPLSDSCRGLSCSAAFVAGNFDIPVGTYNFTLSCNATNFCTSAVTVADQEALVVRVSTPCGDFATHGFGPTNSVPVQQTNMYQYPTDL